MKRTFTVPGAPQGKGRARVSTMGGFARAYTPEKTAKYENLVRLCYIEQYRQAKLKGAVRAVITAYYPIPKSFSRVKRENAIKGLLRPQIKPDADNVVKVIMDALNGLAYDDDRQVVQIFISKYYGEACVKVVLEDESEEDLKEERE